MSNDENNSTNDENDSTNTNWPGALLGIAFLAFLAFICYGDKIIDAISK